LKIKPRHQLRKSQKKEMINTISNVLEDADTVIGKKRIELAQTEDYELILVDGKPLFFITDGKLFFTVRGALELQPQKRQVIVDAGAVSFIIKGADIMRPGIVSADHDIKEGDMVIIVEQTHDKPLAIGRALVSGEEMIGDSGKVIKTIHYVGDRMWNIEL
jgi:PUA-domain protein